MGTSLRISGTVADTSELEAQERRVRKAMSEFSEDFYLIGTELKPIRDSQPPLWKRGGFRSWSDYCKSGRLDITDRRWADKLIRAADVRPLLPKISDAHGASTWTERSVRELLRMRDNEGIRRVANKVATRIRKGDRLTSTLVKELVETDKHGPKIERTRTKVRKQLSQATTPGEALDAITDWLEQQMESLGRMEASFWTDAETERPGSSKRLTQALRDFVSFMKE